MRTVFWFEKCFYLLSRLPGFVSRAIMINNKLTISPPEIFHCESSGNPSGFWIAIALDSCNKEKYEKIKDAAKIAAKEMQHLKTRIVLPSLLLKELPRE